MAKSFEPIEKPVKFDGIMVSQEFNTLATINQIGDQFYVPNPEYIFIQGTVVPAQNGRPERSAGQRFVAVRVIDGKPVEAVELYVGQLVKTDVRGRIVYPGELTNALRRGDAAFKEVICNKILEITEEKEIEDRVWSNEDQAYLRDETTGKYVAQKKMAMHFEPKMLPKGFDVEAANELILDFVKELYPSLVNEK